MKLDDVWSKKMTRKDFLKLLSLGFVVALIFNKEMISNMINSDDIIINGTKIGQIKR